MPFCHLEIRAKRPNYQDNWIGDQTVSATPKTLGEHIRNARLQRRLFQRDLAMLFGVEKTSVQNWERGVGAPCIHVVPKIIEFLGYDPEAVPTSLPRRIAYARRRLGYTQEELAEAIVAALSKFGSGNPGNRFPTTLSCRRWRAYWRILGLTSTYFEQILLNSTLEIQII